MKDEEEDDIIPNEDENNESFMESTGDDAAVEGFDDSIRPSAGSHFYETKRIQRIPLPK